MNHLNDLVSSKLSAEEFIKSYSNYPYLNSSVIESHYDRSKEFNSASSREVYQSYFDESKSFTKVNANSNKREVDDLEDVLYESRAHVKVLFSQVSMYFPEILRKKIFNQIDLLHDIDDWEEGEKPIDEESFLTYVRWQYIFQPSRLPSFGLTSSGNFVASWLKNDNKDSLTLEFLPKDRVRWFTKEVFGEEVDCLSGETNLERSKTQFGGSNADRWFSN